MLITRLRCINPPPAMSKLFVKGLVFAALGTAGVPAVRATGMYTIPQWLEQGGAAANHSPEFYWETELRMIAAPFKPSQKRVERGVIPAAKPGEQAEMETFKDQADKADLADFKDALKQGKLKVADAAKATLEHEAVRDAIGSANEKTDITLPPEPASEFADYDRGALAFRQGEAHYQDAATAWEALLKRPAEERHYHSVWAAFMLGKVAVFTKKPEAAKWFHMTRQLAKDGFSDPLGLAADSYGWEAKSELDQDHLEKAAQLYLTQLALGDDSAIVSLKAFVPDRDSPDGTMTFGPQPPENADEAAQKKFAESQQARVDAALLRAARDPLLRRIVTAHVLATDTYGEGWSYPPPPPDASNPNATPPAKAGDRCRLWLSVIRKAGITEVDDAAALGWTAYTAGRYDEAGRWLKLVKEDNASSLWLRAKLLRREGKTAEAAEVMASAWKKLKAELPAEENPGEEPAPILTDNNEPVSFVNWTHGLRPLQSAGGDLGALRLERGDFVNALDAFFTSGMHEDAAFVADHVLTADELKQYVDEHVKWTARDDKENETQDAADFGGPLNGFALRWMLGRRLVREDRYAEARGYLPPKLREVLDKYTKALADGANEKLPKGKRARAWYNAAAIARYQGMEIMGTEGAPDGFLSGGSYPPNSIADERETGQQTETDESGDKPVQKIKPLPMVVAVTAAEKKRLAGNRTAPNKRFHYRHVAAALGWKAAALLPDQSNELADVLNSSGGWISNDDKAADKFYQAIERRASRTSIGRAAIAKHWFVSQYGPWSEEPKQ